MVVRFYSSVAPETTLSSGITNASTSITVGSVTGFPASTPYTLALDYEGITEELVQVNNAAGTTLTVTRAVDGTSAASHNAGARVRHVSSARDFADSRTHENSDQGIHGLAPGDTLVGEDAVQTLTNKTLTAPVINSPTITGTTSVVNADFSGTLHGTGTGVVRLDNITNASPVSTGHAFQIGLTTAGNMRMDNNEIQAANNGATASLGLQNGGGNLLAFNNVAADSTANSIIANGVIAGTQHQGTRPGATTTTYSSRVTGDVNSRWLVRADGANQYGSGAVAADVTVSRTAPGVLTVDNSLAVVNGFTAQNISATNSVTATGNVAGANFRAGQALSPAPGGSGGTSTVSVTFSSPMSSVPEVVLTPRSAADPTATVIRGYALNITASGFDIACSRSTNSTTQWSWIAMGDA